MIKGLPREAEQDELVGLDIEMFQMSKPHRADGTFACLSVAYENGDAYQVYDSADIPKVLERVSKGVWIMQNALFDLRVLRRYTSVPQRYVHDTMLVEQDLFGGWYGTFGLASLTRRWLGEVMPKDERDNFVGGSQMTKEMEDYAIQDAISTTKIARLQMDHIRDEEDGQFRHYYEIDEPAIWAILDMPPIRINVDAWLANTKTLAATAERSQEELGFNAFSAVQVKKHIEQSLGRSIKNTNAKDTLHPLLDSLRPGDPTAALISRVLEVREARKAVSTYGESWIEQHVEDGEWVYPSWRVTGAETGRMSCAEPNIQQIPARKMPVFRTFFLASKGGRMLVADAASQEVRLAAALSNDDVLYADVSEGKFHQRTADAFGVDYDKGKAINFLLQYGGSKYGLARAAGIDVDEAEEGINKRNRRYKKLTIWQGRQVRKARKQYRVRTLTGRPVWINPYGKQWERNAQNGPVQGSAADHTKLAFVKAHQLSEEAGIDMPVNMVIHDEMCMTVSPGQMKECRQIMEQAWVEAGKEIAPDIELPVEIAGGFSWAVK